MSRAPPPAGPRLRRPAERALAPVVFGGVLALAALAVLAAARSMRNAAEGRFAALTQEVAAELVERVGASVRVLHGVRGFIAASTEVTAAEFDGYVRATGLAPGLDWLGYVERVGPGERADFERRRGGPGGPLQILTDGADPVTYPLVLAAPGAEAGRGLLGLDLGALPNGRQIIDRARADGLASEVVPERFRGGADPALLVVLPTFAPAAAGAPGARGDLSGLAAARVRVGPLVEDALARHADLLDVQVRDERAAETLFDSRRPGEPPPLLAEERQVDVAGRVWTLAFTSRAALRPPGGRPLLAAIAAGGLLLAFGLAALARTAGRARAARRRAVAALERLCAGLDGLYRHGTDAALLADAAGNIVYANPASESVLGRPAARLLGTPLRDIAGPAADAPAAATLPFEHRRPGPDDAEVLCEGTVAAVDDEGAVIARLAVLRDVTARNERLRAEEHERHRDAFLAESGPLLTRTLEESALLEGVARLVVRHLADGCAIDLVDEHGHVRLSRAAWCDPEQEPRFLAGLELYRRARAPDTAFSRLLRGGPVVVVDEFPEPVLLARTGEPRLVPMARDLGGLGSSVAVPIRMDGRTLGAVIAISREKRRFGPREVALVEELGRRIALAVENAQLYARARDAVAARDEFLSIAAHELRTPLTTLNLHLHMSLGTLQKADPACAELLRPGLAAAERQSVRLRSMIDEMLDVSRIAGGQLEIVPGPMDLAEAAREGLRRMEGVLLNAGCAPALEAPGPVPGEWDRARVDQVIVNLLSNAARHAPGSAVRLRVGAQDGAAVLEVVDTGPGIPPDRLSSIFERFERAGSLAPGGLGLGLYIVQRIVSRHGGLVRAENVPGADGARAGARFVVELPLHAERPLAPPSPLGTSAVR